MADAMFETLDGMQCLLPCPADYPRVVVRQCARSPSLANLDLHADPTTELEVTYHTRNYRHVGWTKLGFYLYLEEGATVGNKQIVTHGQLLARKGAL